MHSHHPNTALKIPLFDICLQLLASALGELHTGTATGWEKTVSMAGVALIVDRSKETKPKIIQIFDAKVGCPLLSF